MRAKTFDCVEMKRRGAMRIHERLKGMSLKKQVEYWRRRSEDFRREQELLRRQEPKATDKGAPAKEHYEGGVS